MTHCGDRDQIDIPAICFVAAVVGKCNDINLTEIIGLSVEDCEYALAQGEKIDGNF